MNGAALETGLNRFFQSLMGIMYKIVEGNPPKLSAKYSNELQDLYKRYKECFFLRNKTVMTTS